MTDTTKPTYTELAALVQAFLLPESGKLKEPSVEIAMGATLHLLAIQVLKKHLSHEETELFRLLVSERQGSSWPAREAYFYQLVMFSTDSKPYDVLGELAKLARVKRSTVELALRGLRAPEEHGPVEN